MILIISEFLLLLVVVSIGGTFAFFLLRILQKLLPLNRQKDIYFSMKLIVCYYFLALLFIIPMGIWKGRVRCYPAGGDFKAAYLWKQPIAYQLFLKEYSGIVLGIFIFWVIGFLKNYFFGIYKKRNLLHKLTAASDLLKEVGIQGIKEKIAKEFGIKKEIFLFSCEVISSPFVTEERGIRIFLPKREFSKEEAEFILRHELMHVKSRDLIFREIILYLRCFFWINPLFGLFWRCFYEDCELACDELVLEKETEKRRFSYLCIMRSFLNSSSDLKELVGFFSINLVERRILNVLRLREQKKRGIPLLFVGMILIGILAAGYFIADGVLIIQVLLGEWLMGDHFITLVLSEKIGSGLV